MVTMLIVCICHAVDLAIPHVIEICYVYPNAVCDCRLLLPRNFVMSFQIVFVR